MDNINILVIEDESLIARFIELELMHEGYNVDIAYDGIQGLQNVKDKKYNLILLDIMIPGINGMEVCRKIRQFSNVAIIMITARDEIYDKVMGLDLGADDYITKPFAIEEFHARIRAALRKRKINIKEAEILTFADIKIDESSHIVTRGDLAINLTKTEYELLKYFINNNNIVLTREQLLNTVWGFDYMGDTNIVDVYVRYLRIKMEQGFSDKLIHTVRGFGYIMKEEKDEV